MNYSKFGDHKQGGGANTCDSYHETDEKALRVFAVGMI